MEMKKHQIVWLVALSLLVLAPIQAEATSHSLAQLCAKINCVPILTTILPKITQADSPVTPGGYVVIQGSGFGQELGELWLTGLKHYSGPGLLPIKLTIPPSKPPWDFWTPTQVIGQVPINLTQVTDQQAELEIKTKNGLLSNKFPVNFKATRDIKVLPASYVHSVSCSTESDYDSCTGVPLDMNVIPFCSAPHPSYPAATFRGYHWTCVGDSDGTDSFRFSLTKKNSWSLDHVEFHDAPIGGISQPVIASGSLSLSLNYTQVTIDWDNAPAPYALYGVDVYIVGPKGVPHVE
jgi:hypothetical protein